VIAAFSVGQVVIATVAAQKLEPGERYVVIDVDESLWTAFGGFVVYWLRRQVGDPQPRPVMHYQNRTCPIAPALLEEAGLVS